MQKNSRRNKRAISPVIATVILIAVAVAIGLAVSFWASGLTGTLTKYEKLEMRTAYSQPVAASQCPTGSGAETMIKIIIGKNGVIRFIYSDPLLFLLKEGRATIQRASHVEPGLNGWQADLSLVGGPKLGPYQLRQEALDAEVQWLLQHRIPVPKGDVA
jgi:flagellin-like protein